jgi:hypothetical protein
MSYKIQNLLPRHIKVMDLKIAGFNQKQLAEKLEMTPTMGRVQKLTCDNERVMSSGCSGAGSNARPTSRAFWANSSSKPF